VSDESRGITSAYERGRTPFRLGRGLVNAGLLLFLVVVALGPILWLAKSAITPTQDTLRYPLELWPNGTDWENLRTAWVDIDLKLYFWNTVVIALGSWAVQMVVAVTGGYALSILRPRGSRVIYALVLATMFVPAVVLLVPLYLISPLDLIPDFIPFAGWLDDIVVIPLLVSWIVGLLPQRATRTARSDHGQTIDGDWRRL